MRMGFPDPFFSHFCTLGCINRYSFKSIASLCFVSISTGLWEISNHVLKRKDWREGRSVLSHCLGLVHMDPLDLSVGSCACAWLDISEIFLGVRIREKKVSLSLEIHSHPKVMPTSSVLVLSLREHWWDNLAHCLIYFLM